MISILKSDFYKLLRNKAFYVITLLTMGVSFLMTLAANAGMRAGGGAGIFGDANAAVALTMFIPFNFHLIFSAIFVSLFVASEFQTGTIKNTLSRGSGRVRVFLSKFYVSTVASLVMFALFVLVMMIFGGFLFGFDISGTTTRYGFFNMIFMQMLMLVAYCGVFTFSSMTLRGTGGALASNIISVTMLPSLLNAVSYFLPWDVRLGSFWLDWGVSNLAGYRFTMESMTHGMMLGIGWIVVSLVVGIVLFIKQDVK